MSTPYQNIQSAPPRLSDDARPGARGSNAHPAESTMPSPSLKSEGSSSVPPRERPPTKRQRTLVSVACDTCRKKKQKCDAVRPKCGPCLARNLECIYRAEEDQPRGVALRTQLETLQTELNPMAEVFALLRTEPHNVANDMLRRIRSGADVRTVLEGIVSQDNTVAEELSDAIELADPTITSRRVPYQRQEAMHPEDGIDTTLPGGIIDLIIPAEEVNKLMSQTGQHIWQGVSRWTRLTSNDALVSHLIHVYYDHQQWVCDFNDRQLFLDDFTTRENNFCSELLVNAILANAARASPLVPYRNDPWHDRNPGKLFFQEARRLWNTDESRDSVILVQASLELVYYHYANGQDKMGDRYLYDSIRMARNLGLFMKDRIPQAIDPRDKMNRARAVTAWSLFDFVSLTRISMQLEPLLRGPPSWPFPYRQNAEPREKFHMKKWELARIEHKVCFMLYGFVTPQEGKTTANPMQTEGLYQQLLQWHDTVPKRFEEHESMEPHLVLLQCRFQHVILALFRPFAAPTSTLSLDVHFYEERAREITRQSTHTLRKLVESHMEMEDRNIFSYHYCPMVACNILDEFRQIQQEAMSRRTEEEDDDMGGAYRDLSEMVEQSSSYHTFLTCLKHLLNIGSSLFMSQLALRAVQTAAERSQVALPYEVWEIFSKLNVADWMELAKRNVVSSFAPGKTAQDADGYRIDELLESWDRMSIESANQFDQSGEKS